jgi:hypothetical protein
VVQKRCIGPAKLGSFVLAVDAFGAGERGLAMNLGEYHGEMVAATLLPTGWTLAGLQVYENMRAVDFLLTRPNIHEKQIAITGASGGGNQPMYAGAWCDRFVPADTLSFRWRRLVFVRSLHRTPRRHQHYAEIESWTP